MERCTIFYWGKVKLEGTKKHFDVVIVETVSSTASPYNIKINMCKWLLNDTCEGDIGSLKF
jgi:hypothetical protein